MNARAKWHYYFPELGEEPDSNPPISLPSHYEGERVAEWAHERSDSEGGDYAEEMRVMVRADGEIAWTEFVCWARSERSYHAKAAK